ncbi:probable ATP-dependent RNA helicase DHX58, partial [Aplysia californica]|uniref:Probable ATP-dependent RNA helicase DHX58 n=1 Tax=Aplysia californica TaxID=6500 RepID=A0ABM0JY39_APLCA
MQAYHKTKEETGGEKLPQIVGLTASFGIGNATTNVEGAYMNIVNICGNLDVTKISTVTKHVDEMLKHSPVPVEETVDLKPRESDNFVASMNSCMEDIENKIKGIAKRNGWEAVLKGLQYVPGDRKLQAYRQRIVILKQVAEEHIKPQDDNIKDKILLISLAELLCVCSNALELYDLADIKEVQTFLQEESMDLPNEFLNKLLQMDPSCPVSRNKNLQNLEKVLLEYLVAKGPSSRCIIFVRTRALARLLADSLNSCSSSVHHLNAAVFTGTSTAKESGVKAQRRQEKLLQDFLEGEVKVLVATTVAEEGLDI